MIRPYQTEDRALVLELSREFWGYSCAETFGEFDEAHAGEMLDRFVNSGACFVTNDVDGFLLIAETQSLCNPCMIAAEVAWYVKPSSRGGNGIKLLNAAFRYCELKGIRSLSMMYMQTSMPESIVKIYDKLGLKLSETTYIKRF